MWVQVIVLSLVVQAQKTRPRSFCRGRTSGVSACVAGP